MEYEPHAEILTHTASAVNKLKDKPLISSTSLVDGKEVRLHCISPGKCRNITIPHFSWKGVTNDSTTKTYKTTYKVSGLQTFGSRMTFTPRKSHNNSTLLCRVTFNQGLYTVEKQTLNVECVVINDTTAVIMEDGDSVTLRCIVDSNPNASVTWYKEDMVVHRNISNQTVTIQLISITENDAGRYQCSAMNKHGVTNRSIQIIYRNINCQKPGYEIRTDPQVRVQRGLCAHVPCTFTVPTNIRLSRNTNGFWYRLVGDTGQLVASQVDSKYYTNGRFLLIGDLTRGDCSLYIEEPLSADEGVHVFRLEAPQTQFTYTNIQPYVDVTVLTDKPTISSTRLVDGKEVTMTCTSPGRCRRIAQPRISWEGAMTATRRMDYIFTYEDGTRTFHSNITFTPRKSQNNSPLFCRVTFNLGLSTVERQTLNVEYSPSIIITTEGVDINDTTSLIVEDGDSVTLRCIADSNPNASVTWYKEDMVVHRNISNQTITIQLINIIESDSGRYQCSAMNEHGVTNRSIQIIYRKFIVPSLISAMMLPMPCVTDLGGVYAVYIITHIQYFPSRKRKQNADENRKNTSANHANDTYSYAEFTKPDVSPTEKTLQKGGSEVDDSIYVNSGDVQYSSVKFSKSKHKFPQNQEDTEMEYAEIKKAPPK
ncbi:sialic acid-binding Ig-like lectin 8 [Ranitomeya variabilis]|uniref:sialic acid-binding Ig-like lectin 8 n=1 Tax=Ranitomeya variabilis TaxID=490064 RepID=UPI004057BF34